MTMLTLLLAAAVLLLPAIDCSYFTGVSTRYIQENYDDQHGIWYITAYCYIRYTYGYTCYGAAYYDCGYYSTCVYYYAYTCYAHAYADVVCNRCAVISDPSGNFATDGFQLVVKKACSQHTCSTDCPNYDGCLKAPDTHTVGVRCWHVGYETPGTVDTTFNVVVTSANPPTFYYSGGSSISISHDTASVGTVISTIVPSLPDDGYDYDYVRFRQDSGPAASYILHTPDLFYLDTSNGQVKVKKDLSMEFSYFYDMDLCVVDRRGQPACNTLHITLWACFQTPNCTSQWEWNLHDTYGTYTGHGGSSNLIFSQQYPEPDEHFPYFSTVWHKLTWTFDFNEFPEATINPDTGDIYVTRNISIWPAWPTQDYNARVRVSNSESCYTTTCNFFVRIYYTNWPIEIRSLPNDPQYYQHEDDDNGYLLHSLIVYDYNYETEDNMTCYIHRISPHEDNLFYLHHDGRYKWDSYTLYKLDCQNPDCGYKHPLPEEFQHSAWQRFYCDTDIGCLTYNRTQQYTVTIKCNDSYGSTDEKDYTFNVIKNEVPKYRLLPTHVALDINDVSQYDIIFEIMYWDLEEENLNYEYTYEDTDTSLDPGYFLGTTWGNYYNQLGNISMTTYLWDKEVNRTYRIHVCGHERRNEICEDLLVYVQEYCSEAPVCTSPTTSLQKDMTLALHSELFDLSALVEPPASGVPFSDLSYSIKAPQGHLFDVDSTTGSITLVQKFPEVYPSATYTLVGFVYNAGACDRGTCQLTVKVDFVNFPIEITNDPATITVHEDTSSVFTLFTVLTSDDNEDDSYTCNITSSTSVEPFYLDRIPPKTGYYYVKNRAHHALSATPSQYNIEISCFDLHGSSDSYTLVILIEPNKAPEFDSASFSTAGLTVNANIENYSKNDTIYTVVASDTEGDTITWTCSVDNNWNPLACKNYSTYVSVYLRRSLKNQYDKGVTYSVKVCIGDTKHPVASCGDLHVTFTQSRTEPSISNMNEWPLYVAEDTQTGQVLFQPTIVNPDLNETVTVVMNVYPTKYTDYFRFDKGANKLLLKKALDYEKVKEFRFEFAVKDNYLMGLQNYTGFMYVTNVNEGNTLTADVTKISFPEDTAVGAILPDLGLSCLDTDGDDVTLGIQSGYNNDFFSMDPVTGSLTLVKKWDLESAVAQSTLLTVQCSDPGGLTSTAEVEISVTDVNEFAPLCNAISVLSNPFQISPATKLSTVLMTIECSDPDRDDDGVFYSHPVGGGLAHKYFRTVQRNSRKRATGSTYTDIKLLKPINFSNDKLFVVSFEITDGEGNALSTGFNVSVNFTANDPGARHKQSKKCLTCTANGRVIIAVLCLEFVLIVMFVIHAACAMRGRKQKTLRLPDVDKNVNSRFHARNVVGAASRSPFDTLNSVPKSGPSTVAQSGRMRHSLSDSSSSESSDDDDVKRPAVKTSSFIFPTRQLPGLPRPVHGSGPTGGQVRAPGLQTVRSGPTTSKSTGLPAPIYSSRTTTPASAGFISTKDVDLF